MFGRRRRSRALELEQRAQSAAETLTLLEALTQRILRIEAETRERARNEQALAARLAAATHELGARDAEHELTKSRLQAQEELLAREREVRRQLEAELESLRGAEARELRFQRQWDRLDKVVRRLERTVVAVRSPQRAPVEAAPRPALAAVPPEQHLRFFATGDRYALEELQGAPPAVGEVVDLGARGAALVTKVGTSPLPNDRRPCAYVIGVPPSSTLAPTIGLCGWSG